MRVLVVEDHASLRTTVAAGLRDAGYSVDAVGDAERAVTHLQSDPYDLLVLDLGLPDRDGLELLQALRRRGLTLPVLVLTARGSLEDRVTGLDAGADDYLAKPFAFPEFLARLRALLRRGDDLRPTVLTVDDVELDPARFEVRRGGRPVPLTAKEFAILEYLMCHAGEVVPRTTLLERCWDASYDGLSNLVDVNLSRLRRKLEAHGEPCIIHTVRGVGIIIGTRPA